MSDNTVAIIMPVFNAEKTLERAIDSIISQEYKNWRLYIINDASTDSTKELVNLYLDDDRITYVENEGNIGVSKTRNVGLKLSNESLISFFG